MTIQEAHNRLLFQLYHIYDNAEAGNIADWVMEHLTGWKRIDRILNKEVKMSAFMQAQLEKYILELNNHRPVQYVLNEAWFCGMKFYVDENVLIPRPETEELVEWIVNDLKGRDISILDIGTGSGCIAIALKKKLPLAKVFACDVSEGALAVARKNALNLGADVEFININILTEKNKLPGANVIVSNPPYIPLSEKNTMGHNVVQHEPHLALFVEDNDPLLFYKTIKDIPAHSYYFEVHENLAHQVAELFKSADIQKDLQGKERMVKAFS